MKWIAGLITSVIYLFLAIQFESWLFNFISGLFNNADVGVIMGLLALFVSLGPVLAIGIFLVLMVVAVVAALVE